MMVLVELATPILAFASRIGRPEIALMLLVAVLIFFAELVFFFVPGLSLSTLFIAMACIKFGFVPSLAIAIPPILIVHLFYMKNPSIAVGDIVTMVIMVLFGSYAGPYIISTVGWGLFGSLFGFVKWGTMILTSFMYGGNMGKRVQNILLEPIFNFFIFWKLRLLFGFLI
jgi:hypothetical protein